MKKMFAVLMIAIMIMCFMPAASFGATAPDWDVSKSKEATNLDSNYESGVMLSLPSASYKGTLDVAFVLDGSTSTDENDLAEQAAELLEELASMKNLTVKVGLTVFGGTVSTLIDTELLDISDKDNLEMLQKELINKEYDKMTGRSGSNLQAGIEAARKKLNADIDVESSDKYIIILSDGAARMWVNSQGEPMSQAYYTSGRVFWNSNEDFIHRYGTLGTEANVKELRTFEKVWYAGNNQGKEIGKYGLTEDQKNNASEGDVASWDTVANDEDYYTTYEAATYYAAQSIVKASKESRVILVSYPYHEDKTYGKYTESFKEWLASEGYVTRYDSNAMEAGEIFEAVKDELIQVVDAGSYVIDEIGNGEDFNFDFVNNLDALDLTVGGIALDKELISDNAYGFGKIDDGKYRFIVTYYPDGNNINNYSYDECFVWEINEAVIRDKHVQLTYKVKLTNHKTAPGTYGVKDLNGDGIIDGTNMAVEASKALYTNNKAVLVPVDSQNRYGDSELFPQPSVSYTVSAAKGDDVPKTGDLTATYMYACIFLLTLSALAGVKLSYRKKHRN